MLGLYCIMIAAFLHCFCVGHCYQGTFVIHNVSGSFFIVSLIRFGQKLHFVCEFHV